MNSTNEKSAIVARLKSARMQLKLKQKEFATAAGIDPHNYSSVESGARPVGDNVLNKIARAHNINLEWLLSGVGEPFVVGGRDYTDKFAVTKLPMSAIAGTLREYFGNTSAVNAEQIISPIGNVDFAIQISGESMSPEYPNGAQILIKRIDERAFIEWGRVYVLDTRNGVVVKKIMPAGDTETVKCVSINPEFPPFEIAFADIFGMYRVLMCMSLK